MKKIKDVFKKEIDNGSINWEKLENKIHTALPLLEGQYSANTVEGKSIKAKLEDALTFPVINPDTQNKRCYKIFKPRFINGSLYCVGLQIGLYSTFPKEQPIFIQEIEWF